MTLKGISPLVPAAFLERTSWHDGGLIANDERLRQRSFEIRLALPPCACRKGKLWDGN